MTRERELTEREHEYNRWRMKVRQRAYRKLADLYRWEFDRILADEREKEPWQEPAALSTP
jgi:hypothetical protein